MQTDYDAIIVGTGQAGPALANRLSAAGMKVALIERGQVGGTCVNTGCTPTKAMVASAYAVHLAKRASDFGINITGSIQVDMAAIHARVTSIVDNDRHGLESWIESMPNCTLIRAHARFEGPHQLRAGDASIGAARIFLNVGARPQIPDIPGLDTVGYLTSTDMVRLKNVPAHLLIVGGSYVGLEFAQVLRRFGAKVTVLARGSRLLALEDPDISDGIKQLLLDESIDIRTDTLCTQLERRGPEVIASLMCNGVAHETRGSHVLVATGRRPNTDDLALDEAGIAIDRSGYIVVDDQLKTNVEGVWALGDCNGHGGFTHTAYNDYEIAASNLLDGGNRRLSDRIRASALYLDPPLGRVGLTLAEAKRLGKQVRVGMRPMTRVARAKEKGETRGLMRIIVDAETSKILGATVMGPGGDEAIHEVLALMYAGSRISDLTNTVAIHPTVSELIPTIAGELSAPF